MKFKSEFSVLVALVFVAQAALAGNPKKQPKCDRDMFDGAPTVDLEFVRVVDGDTIKVAFDSDLYSIRMLSMDTPETHYLGKSQGYWADKATERLGQILKDVKIVTIELGNEVCDKYGRILGTVWVGKTDVNRQMVAEGLAVNYCIAPNLNHCEEYADLTQNNVDEKVGIFSGRPAVEIPYDWRRKTSNRPFEKFVGNIDTHEVFSPESEPSLPVAKRVFFMKKTAIQAPYHYVGD